MWQKKKKQSFYFFEIMVDFFIQVDAISSIIWIFIHLEIEQRLVIRHAFFFIKKKIQPI